MTDGFLFGKLPASIMSIGRPVLPNWLIMSAIFIKDGWPEMFTDVCVKGLFIFFNKSFKNL